MQGTRERLHGILAAMFEGQRNDLLGLVSIELTAYLFWRAAQGF
ncbi:hypothetical protein [Bosea sp. F3-2]|nr:hypothetical protein [Bosea sp. F3-2]